MTFDTLDYIIFVATLLISASIGVYYRFTGGKQKTNDEFLLGSQNQNPIWVAFSLMASFMSAVSMLGGSAEAYIYGTHFFLINIGNSLGIIASVFLFVPTFYELKTVSVYQYLAKRFGNTTRTIASIASTLQMLLYMSIALVAPSIALQTVTKISYEISIIISGIACISYATLGGMKAIIITDVFQSVLMFGSMIAVIISGFIRFESLGKIIDIADHHGRINFTDFRLDLTVRHTWISTIVGGFVNSLILNGINQTQVQRYLTLKNYKQVKIAAVFSAPILSALSLCICFSGLTIFAEYANCDPLKNGSISTGDQLLAYYVTNTFQGSGLSGLFVAGIFSAALSTVSPLLNSLAAVTLEDYLKPTATKYTRLKDKQFSSSYYTQILTLLYGAACLCISLLALQMTSLLQASIIVFNFVGGPLLGIFTLGMFTEIANQKGTIAGFFIGMICIGTLSVIPKPKYPPLSTSVSECMNAGNVNYTLYSMNKLSDRPESSIIEYILRISYLYYGIIGFLITFVIGYVVSLAIKDDKKINANLLHKRIAKPLLKKGTTSIYQENEERELQM